MGATRVRYNAAYGPFSAWLKREKLVSRTEDDLDQAVVEWLEKLFFEGRGVEDAGTLIAAALWKNPRLRRRGGLSLSRARRTVKGWKAIRRWRKS